MGAPKYIGIQLQGLLVALLLEFSDVQDLGTNVFSKDDLLFILGMNSVTRKVLTHHLAQQQGVVLCL